MKKDSAVRILFDCLLVENENLNLETMMNKILYYRKFKNVKFMLSVC